MNINRISNVRHILCSSVPADTGLPDISRFGVWHLTGVHLQLLPASLQQIFMALPLYL